MARVVESVAKDYEGRLIWEKVVTKDLRGARRYMDLSREQGRNLPVPSIIINGRLVFEVTPSQEELKAFLDRLFREADHDRS